MKNRLLNEKEYQMQKKNVDVDRPSMSMNEYKYRE